jgi:hypothetical protein
MAVQTLDVERIGRICEQTHQPYGAVCKAIETLRIKPVLVIDGIRHFTPRQRDRIHRYLLKQTAAKKNR